MVAAYQSFASNSATLGGSITVTKPSGTVNGDLLIAHGICSGGTVVPPDGTWNLLAGWTFNENRVWWKIASGEGASYVWTQPGLQTSKVTIIRVNGQAASSPIEAGSSVTLAGATIVMPSITTLGANRLLLQSLQKGATCTFTPPGGTTERYDSVDGTGTSAAGGDETIATASATGSRTWTPSDTGANGYGYMMAIKAAATDTAVSTDLVGVGVPTKAVAVAEPRNVVGDGVASRVLAETTVRALTGDGVLSSAQAVVASKSFSLVGDGVVSRVVDEATVRALTGDGVLTSAKAVVASKSTDLVGDGVVTRQMAETTSRDLSGDGVVSRQLGIAESYSLAGDGVVVGIRAVAESRDLVGDGVITRGDLPVGLTENLVGDGVVSSAKAVVASKSFDLVGDGVITEAHGTDVLRSFDLVGDGIISGSVDIPFPNIPVCPGDWPDNDGLKSISGTVLFHEPPNEGDPVDGATVALIRDSDGLLITTTTTAPDGTYSFPRDSADPYTYHVEVNYENLGVKQQGLSEGGCIPE